MLLSAAWDAFVNFINEEKILLIIIAIAIILLIVVSLLGRKKNKKKSEEQPKEGELATDNVATEDTAEVKTEEVVSEEKPEAQTEETETEEKTEETETEKVAAKKKKAASKKTEKDEDKTNSADEVVAAEAVAVEDEEEPEAEETEEIADEPEETEEGDDGEDGEEETETGNTRAGIVEIYKGKEDYYFTFRSFHGYLIGRSQGYSTKASCKNGVQAVMNACAEAEIYDNSGKDAVNDYSPAIGNAMFEIYKDKAGKFRFRLFAKNAQNIAASEDYTTKAALKNAIGSLKKIAENYTLKDSTLKRKPKADK